MTKTIARDLRTLVTDTVTHLSGVEEALTSVRSRGGWSAKEVLGHLIDSAANNHQRFVRAQREQVYEGPGYEQDDWVRVQHYQGRPWQELLELWAAYNRHLAYVIERIPQAALSVECRVGHYQPCTLGYVVEDYLAHMRHHLRQIADRLHQPPQQPTP